MCRIGEAANPGPSANDAFTIGCINPTGLLGRGSLIAELPKARESTTWAVSESHLSAPGKAKLQKELAYHKAGYHLQTGAMTPTRSNTISSIAGKHRGVAFLSTSPCRTMSATWPKSDWDAARFHVSCFQVGQRWVQGGVIYGYAAQPETSATKTKTEELCQHVIKRLLQHSQGLRFIAGDLNQPDDALPSMQQLKEAGWVNVQQWAMEKLNKPIQVTCKNKSTKDHIYVSPELAMYLKDCEVQHDWFPDHSVCQIPLTGKASQDSHLATAQEHPMERNRSSSNCQAVSATREASQSHRSISPCMPQCRSSSKKNLASQAAAPT